MPSCQRCNAFINTSSPAVSLCALCTASRAAMRQIDPPPRPTHGELITRFMARENVTEVIARNYLVAEEWSLTDALTSYRCDQLAGLRSTRPSGQPLDTED